MPAITSEAIANKARLRKERDRKKSAAKRHTLKKSDLREYKISARRMRGRLPPMSKDELRQMITQAFQNTARES